MSSGEHLSEGTLSLLTLLSRRPQKKLREVSSGKVRDPPDEGFSSLRLEYASKEARSEPPSSTHFNKNDKSPQEALQSNSNASGSKRTPARYARQRCPTRMKPPRHARR